MYDKIIKMLRRATEKQLETIYFFLRSFLGED